MIFKQRRLGEIKAPSDWHTLTHSDPCQCPRVNSLVLLYKLEGFQSPGSLQGGLSCNVYIKKIVMIT